MGELTESARQCLVSQGIIVGTLSIFTSLGLLVIGTILLVRVSDILHFASLSHLAALEIVSGASSLLVTAYVCWITVSYRNRQLETRSKYLDESMSKGLVAIILPFLVTLSGFFVSAIFLMVKTQTSSTNNLMNVMTSYSMNEQSKVLIDTLQMLLKCCGSQSFLDWFVIDWQNPDFSPSAQVPNGTRTGWDSVPFSCCCVEAPPPCIHRQIQVFGVDSLYTEGCALKLDRAVSIFVLFSLILLLISTCLLFIIMYSSRKLQTSARAAIKKGDATAPGAWWLLMPPKNHPCIHNDLIPLLDNKKLTSSRTVVLCDKPTKISASPTLVMQKSKFIDSTADEWIASKTQCRIDDDEGYTDWTRRACEPSGSTSTTSFITTSIPIHSTESRRSVSDTAVANMEVSHHFEHKVRPLYRT